MLGRCYKAELSKLLKGKGIYVALAVMVVLIAFFAIMSSILFGSVDIGGMIEGDMLETIRTMPREQYDTAIQTLEAQLDMIRMEHNSVGNRFSDPEGQLITYISMLKFFQSHEEVNVSTVIIPMMGLASLGQDAMSFMMNAIELAMEIAVIYAVIMMATLLAGSMHDGTLRMELLRPNARHAVLSAKWLAVFTVSMALMIVGTIISSVYAVLRFGAPHGEVLYVIANTNVGVMSEYTYLLVLFLFGIMSLVAIMMFSMFMCTISRYNRAVSMALPIVVLMIGGTSAYLLQVVYLGVLDFTYSIALRQFIAPMGTFIPHTSLYTALPVLIVYTVLFAVLSHIRFNRTEL